MTPAATRLTHLALALTIFTAAASAVYAQTPATEDVPPAPAPAVTEAAPSAPAPAATGSVSVFIGGKPAQRVGDKSADGQTIVEGSPNVFINGKPAAIVGGRSDCGKGVSTGSSNVFINGKPVARAGDSAGPCK